MISEVHIENFKSIEDLTVPLGRITVLIGENGSGKSNILEAIAFLGAAADDKLDNELLVNRGIRVTDDALMYAAFDGRNLKSTKKRAKSRKHPPQILLSATNGTLVLNVALTSPKFVSGKEIGLKPWISYHYPDSDFRKFFFESEKGLSNALKNFLVERTAKFDPDKKILEILEHSDDEFMSMLALNLAATLVNKDANQKLRLSDYRIYSPENSALRTFQEEGQSLPLGIRGQGLFKLLQSFHTKNQASKLAELKRSLELVGWFLDFEIPTDPAPGDNRLRIKDRYIHEGQEVDQRSANEGFLFLLFYFTTFLSEQAPPFFAIDNIDASLNPKLCAQMMTRLVSLSKKMDKQAILTTHNPAILDGLDLNDKDQILYVVFRDENGRTKLRRIQPPRQLKKNVAPIS